MKKLMVLSLLTTVMVLAGGLSALVHAQTPANDLKPTFISPTPGLYVNGWPAFTLSYPKEWVAAALAPGNVYAAGVARPDIAPNAYLPLLRIAVFGTAVPLEDWAKITMPGLLTIYTDIKILYDKPSQLKDGTPSREVEWEGVLKYDPAVGSIKNGPKINNFMLMTKKGFAWVEIFMIDEGKIGEGLKRIAYFLAFQQGKEETVKLPPDVQTFLDMYSTDMVNHDLGTIMAHFSDRFLNSGMNKAFMEQYFRNAPLSPVRRGVISQEPNVTVFEPRGDKAYVDGFWLQKAKGDSNPAKAPMTLQQIINEHGEWKWFGNQK